MNNNYDRHDFFRIAIPGYVFLLVIATFWLVVKGQIATDWNILIGSLAIGFPLGYVIQAIYHYWEVSPWGDLESLDGKEGSWLEKELNTKGRSDLIEKIFQQDSETSKQRQLSWCLESFVFLQNEKGYSRRSHELVSRIHSAGATSWAVPLAIVCGLIIGMAKIFESFYCCCIFACHLGGLALLSIFWYFVMIFFWRQREYAKEVFGLFSKNFVRRKLNKIIDFIENEEMYWPLT